jgi:hypothetical protein
MPLDPEARTLMDQLQGTLKPFNESTVEEARAAIQAVALAAGAPEPVAPPASPAALLDAAAPNR